VDGGWRAPQERLFRAQRLLVALWLRTPAHIRIAAAFALAAVCWSWVPHSRFVEVRSFAWVETPKYATRFPHPVVQLQALEPPLLGAWVSDFTDLGLSTSVLAAELTSSRGYARSATNVRSFRIAKPAPSDADFVTWKAIVPGTTMEARRYLQLAIAGNAPPAAPPLVRVQCSSRGWSRVSWLLLFLAALLATWPSVQHSLRGRAPRPLWSLLVPGALGAVLLGTVWAHNWVDADEGFLVGTTRAVVQGHYALHEFNYPHLLAYSNAVVASGYGLYRATSGQVAYHDPHTNQLFFDGVGFGRKDLFTADDFPTLFFEESLRVVRKSYAIIALLAAAGVWWLSRRVAGPAAATWASVCFLVQPLVAFQASAILPNLAAAAVALLGIAVLTHPLTGGFRTLGVGVLAGLALSFKYNPVVAVVAVAVAWADRPARTRLASVGLVVAGVALGFLLGCPSVLVYPRDFVADVAAEAYHYGFLGHQYFEADDPWGVVLHGLHLRSGYWGNYLVATLAGIGFVRVAREAAGGAWRRAWILLGPPLLSLGFLLPQFVQFARNYTAFVAFACVLAGLGADWVLLLAGRVRGVSSRVTTLALGGLLVAAIFSVAPHLWRDPWREGPSAREQAIAWVNASAPLGSRVLLIEPLIGSLQGVTIDSARFKVRRLGDEAGLVGQEADFIVASSSRGFPEPLERRVFRDQGSSQLPREYAVLRYGLERQTGAQD
jgi:hypothetical protein